MKTHNKKAPRRITKMSLRIAEINRIIKERKALEKEISI